MDTEIIDAYRSGKESGWPGSEQAAVGYQMVKDDYNFVDFQIVGAIGAPPKFSENYRVARKVLGKDIGGKLSVQLIGDCVSWGMKHAIEYLSCVDILMRKDAEEFHHIFSPYIYGISRVQVGGGRMSGDGSIGSWAAAGVMKYGTIFVNKNECPPYGKDIARKWGSKGPDAKFIDIGKKYLVQSAAKVKTWDDLIAGLANGYSCTVASDQGFEMTPGADGYHDPSGSWAHQMCIYDYCLVDQEHAYIANSWGDSHGVVKNPGTGEEMPRGTLKVKRKIIERMIGQGDTFLVSQFNGFPNQDIPAALFDLVGK